jgi:hypothetical protein
MGMFTQIMAINSCVLLHLERDYLLTEETLSGSLHFANCTDPLSQLMVVLVDQEHHELLVQRIKTDNSPRPFQFDIPADALPGLYQLVVFEPNTLKIYFQQTLPIFNLQSIDLTNFSDDTSRLEPNIANISQGIGVNFRQDQEDRQLYLDLNVDPSWQLPLTVSMSVSDDAQCLNVDKPFDFLIGDLGGNQDSESNPIANTTFTFNGYLKDQYDKGCAYCPLILTIPEDSSGIFYTRSDDHGRFTFTGLTHEGDKKAYLWHQYDSLNPMKFSFPANIRIPEITKSRKFFDPTEAMTGPVLVRRLLATKLNASKSSADSLQSLIPMKNYEQVVLYPSFDFQVIFEQFYLERSMKGTLKSIVPNVNFVKKDQVRVFSYEQQGNYPEAPLILLDGMPIDNNRLLSLDPGSIHRVEVIHKTSNLGVIGNIARNGVISVVTRSGTDYRDIPGVERIYIPGFYQPEAAITRLHSKEELAQILLWDPDLIIDQQRTQVKIKLPEYRLRLQVTILGTDTRETPVYFYGQYGDY